MFAKENKFLIKNGIEFESLKRNRFKSKRFKGLVLFGIFVALSLLFIDSSFAASDAAGFSKATGAFDKFLGFLGGKFAYAILAVAIIGLGIGIALSEDIKQNIPKFVPYIFGGGLIVGFGTIGNWLFGSSATIATNFNNIFQLLMV